MGFKFAGHRVKYALREFRVARYVSRLSAVYQIDKPQKLIAGIKFRRSPFTQAAIFFKYLVPATYRTACCAPSIARSWIIAEPNLPPS
jgi:hypothetical protein